MKHTEPEKDLCVIFNGMVTLLSIVRAVYPERKLNLVPLVPTRTYKLGDKYP